MKVKVTNFKTKRINRLTGGLIKTFTFDLGTLENSFISKNGTYIGSYREAWWYIRNKMVVCDDYPTGVAIVLKSYTPKITLKNTIKDKFESWFAEQWENDNLKGYHGYSQRGGQTFKIGDRLFDENYEPKEEDYTKSEWKGFLEKREDSIKRNIESGYVKNREEALKETPLSNVIFFKLRGSKKIENWEEAKQAAINVSKHLS